MFDAVPKLPGSLLGQLHQIIDGRHIPVGGIRRLREDRARRGCQIRPGSVDQVRELTDDSPHAVRSIEINDLTGRDAFFQRDHIYARGKILLGEDNAIGLYTAVHSAVSERGIREPNKIKPTIQNLSKEAQQAGCA